MRTLLWGKVVLREHVVTSRGVFWRLCPVGQPPADRTEPVASQDSVVTCQLGSDEDIAVIVWGETGCRLVKLACKGHGAEGIVEIRPRYLPAGSGVCK